MFKTYKTVFPYSISTTLHHQPKHNMCTHRKQEYVLNTFLNTKNIERNYCCKHTSRTVLHNRGATEYLYFEPKLSATVPRILELHFCVGLTGCADLFFQSSHCRSVPQKSGQGCNVPSIRKGCGALIQKLLLSHKQ